MALPRMAHGTVVSIPCHRPGFGAAVCSPGTGALPEAVGRGHCRNPSTVVVSPFSFIGAKSGSSRIRLLQPKVWRSFEARYRASSERQQLAGMVGPVVKMEGFGVEPHHLEILRAFPAQP